MHFILDVEIDLQSMEAESNTLGALAIHYCTNSSNCDAAHNFVSGFGDVYLQGQLRLHSCQTQAQSQDRNI